MSDIRFSQHILTPDFKYMFSKIPKKDCKECGKLFRVTHWCKTHERQIWIPNWEIIIRANFKQDKIEPYQIHLDTNEEKYVQKEHLHFPQKKPLKQAVLPKEQEKKQILQLQQSKKRPQSVTATKTPQASKKQYAQLPHPSKLHKNKLSLPSTAQLTQKEREAYEQFKIWRHGRVIRENIKPHMIVPDESLLAIIYYRVSNTNELIQITGVTPDFARKYGTDILRIMIRNGMATGIKTYQQQRKQTPLQKIVSNDSSNQIKLVVGCVACIIMIAIVAVVIQLF